MKVVLAFSKTIIIEDIIEELPQCVTDKSFQDTMQIILQLLSIKRWPSTETELRPGAGYQNRMKFKLLAVLFIAAANFETFEATDTSLVQHFMKNELAPPGVILQPEGDSGVCPREVKVSWRLQPPFTLENYPKEDQPQVNGMFHEALEFALGKCCTFYLGKKSTMQYLTISENSSALQRMALKEDISLSFPFQLDWYIDQSRRYINIFDSPGIVIIRRGPSHTTKERRAQLLKAILGAWPVVVLSLLMSSLAGICVWMLVGPHLYLK